MYQLVSVFEQLPFKQVSSIAFNCYICSLSSPTERAPADHAGRAGNTIVTLLSSKLGWLLVLQTRRWSWRWCRRAARRWRVARRRSVEVNQTRSSRRPSCSRSHRCSSVTSRSWSPSTPCEVSSGSPIWSAGSLSVGDAQVLGSWFSSCRKHVGPL